jgi:hypothetical protein
MPCYLLKTIISRKNIHDLVQEAYSQIFVSALSLVVINCSVLPTRSIALLIVARRFTSRALLLIAIYLVSNFVLLKRSVLLAIM